MPVTPHIEHHFTATNTVRDIVMGMSDGLTVPFAQTAGISNAVAAATGVVVTAGLAEIGQVQLQWVRVATWLLALILSITLLNASENRKRLNPIQM